MKHLISILSEKQILQLSNDMSEGIASGNVKDWRAVAKYFRLQVDSVNNDLNSIRPTVAAMVVGQDCVKYAHEEMKQWLKRVKS